MSKSDTLVTKEDIEQSNWQTFISDAVEHKCFNYFPLFSKKVREVKKSGNIRVSRVFDLFLAIVLAAQRLDMDAKRTFLVTGEVSGYPFSFVDSHMDVLKELVAEISDPEMRARVADLVWTLQVYKRDATRDYRLVVLAIESYLKVAKLLEELECWRELARRLKHAIHLARSFSQPALATDTLGYIQSLLDKYADLTPSFPFADMMEVLQQYEAGNTAKNAALAEREALRSQEAGRWSDERRYWDIKAAWHKMENDENKRLESLMLAAETYVNEADDAITGSQPSYLRATVFVNDAITRLERSGGSIERIEELQRKRAIYQKKMVSEMKPIEVSQDISEFVTAAREHVTGKTLIKGLCDLAFIVAPPKLASLEADVLAGSEITFKDLTSGMTLNKDGKTVRIRRSILSNDADERKRAQKDKMLEQARYYQGFNTIAVIEPARKQIGMEHSIQVKDILPIVSENPFVPPGREMIFARGLQAGLLGDFLISNHLLIPQLENSLRHLLAQHDLMVTGDNQRIEYEYLLGKILYENPFRPTLEDILGEDILFDLQGLLGEEGSNLRNLIAHGLMDADEFDASRVSQISYLSWLVLRLCITFKFSASFKE